MIVGFPGETEQDFEKLCQFVEAAQFDRLGVFSYSDEDTSKSFELDQKVDARTIYNRKRHLMSIQKKISRKRNRALIGREFRCWSKAHPPIPNWSGRRGFRRRRPKSTASATSPIPANIPCAPATSAPCASPRRTITI